MLCWFLLYNSANHMDDDFFADEQAEVLVKEVKIHKFLTDPIAGNVACTKVSGDIIKMNAPYNKPEPSVYFNCEMTDKSSNRPLVCFVRKPGMIVSYENISAWTAGIPSTGKNEYILGIFVLNSLNEFRTQDYPVDSLEEYVRKSEMADHTSWNDWSDSGFNPRIISKIQKTVTKVIGNEYAADDIEHQPKENSELSRYMGDLILPPDGFGKGANVNSSKPSGGSAGKTQKKFSFAIIPSGIKYKADKMYVPMELKTAGSKKIRHTSFEMQISGVGGMDEWVNGLKLNAPFAIDEIHIDIDTFDGKKVNFSLKIDNMQNHAVFRDVSFACRKTSDNTIYGLDISSSEEHSMKIFFNVIVKLKQKNVKTVFMFEKG